MFIYVTGDFNDLEHGKKRRKLGQLLEVTEERGQQIIKAGYGKKLEPINLVPEVAEEVAEPKAEPKKASPKKTATKKAE